MLDDHIRRSLALELGDAERTRVRVMPCSTRHPSLTVDDACRFV